MPSELYNNSINKYKIVMKYYTKITRNEDLITHISNRENEQWFQEKKKKIEKTNMLQFSI